MIMKQKRHTTPTMLSAPTESRYALLIGRASDLSGLPVDQLLGGTRGVGNTSLWRFVIWWVLRSEGATFQQVASYFDRTHSAVVHGVSRIDSVLNDSTIETVIRRIKHGDTDDQ